MKIRKIIMIVLCCFLSTFGFSSWVVASGNTTGNEISINNDETVNVNAHYRVQDSTLVTTTEYFIPSQFSINFNISASDASGKSETDKISAESYKPNFLHKELNGDERQKYYDITNGKYTYINEHSTSSGPSQIKSFGFAVNEWNSSNSSSDYSDLWNCDIGGGYRLRFAEYIGNPLQTSRKYSIGDVCMDEFEYSRTQSTNGNQTITEIVYLRAIVDSNGSADYGYYKKLGIWFTYEILFYYVTFQARMVRIAETRGNTSDYDYDKNFTIKKNSCLTPFDLGIQNYANYGFFSDINCSEMFNFQMPVNDDIDIYVRYLTGDGNLSTLINNLQSGDMLSLYDKYMGGSSGDLGGTYYDVSEDLAYYKEIESVFLDTCNIQNGATVNLTYGNSEIYIEPITGNINENLGAHQKTTDSSIATDYQSSTYVGNENRSISVILNGDLTIKGKLNVGAQIGSYGTSATYFSFINGLYAEIDLYGHSIIVDGGEVNCYGVIKDSVGGGEIIVKNSGQITATVTVTDGRGRNNEALGITKRQAPFTEYKFSYLMVPAYFEYGTTFIGYLKMDFADFGINNLQMTMIGIEDSLFLRGDEITDFANYILYEPYFISDLSNNPSFHKQLYEWRARFIFNANIVQNDSMLLSATVEISSVTLDFNIGFERIDFPISPFFDFIINDNCNFYLYSKLTFYPGSSCIIKENANLWLMNVGIRKYDDISKSFLNFGVTLPGETRYIAGGIMTYTNNIKDVASMGDLGFSRGIYNLQTYWNYVKQSYIQVEGNILFDDTIDTNASTNDGYYYLSGNIELSDKALNNIIANRYLIKTYDIKGEINSSFIYDGNHASSNTIYQYCRISAYNINPLISSNTAYIIDKDNLLQGSFDNETGIFTDNNEEKYFFLADTDMYEDGSDSANQSSRIDRMLYVTRIDKTFEEQRIIKSNNNYYLFYCGIYVPIVSGINDDSDINSVSNGSYLTINARKFMSNNSTETYKINMSLVTKYSDGTITKGDTVSTIVSNCYDSLIVTFNKSSSSRKYYCFSQYSKVVPAEIPDEGYVTYYSY